MAFFVSLEVFLERLFRDRQDAFRTDGRPCTVLILSMREMWRTRWGHCWPAFMLLSVRKLYSNPTPIDRGVPIESISCSIHSAKANDSFRVISSVRCARLQLFTREQFGWTPSHRNSADAWTNPRIQPSVAPENSSDLNRQSTSRHDNGGKLWRRKYPKQSLNSKHRAFQ
jgi:hypothetical protein